MFLGSLEEVEQKRRGSSFALVRSPIVLNGGPHFYRFRAKHCAPHHHESIKKIEVDPPARVGRAARARGSAESARRAAPTPTKKKGRPTSALKVFSFDRDFTSLPALLSGPLSIPLPALRRGERTAKACARVDTQALAVSAREAAAKDFEEKQQRRTLKRSSSEGLCREAAAKDFEECDNQMKRAFFPPPPWSSLFFPFALFRHREEQAIDSVSSLIRFDTPCARPRSAPPRHRPPDGAWIFI